MNPKGIGRDAEHGKEPATKHGGLEGSCAGIVGIPRGLEDGKIRSCRHDSLKTRLCMQSCRHDSLKTRPPMAD